ncbi:MAG TPA: ATP-binding protein [Blastocatellia bacterium]|nr:ATP-binding protein [Blastocatellia bacterium]
MSLLEIIKLVGFATGAALHLYIAWLIFLKLGGRRKRSGPAIRSPSTSQAQSPVGNSITGTEDELPGFIQSERTFIMLGLCLGLWFLGNLLITLQEVLLGPGRATPLLRAWNTVAVVGIALFPSALLHSHLAFWSWMDGYRVMSRARVRLGAILFYIPMAVLPYTVYRVNTGDYKPFLAKLHFLLVPYSVWFLLASWSAAVLDWAMKDRLYKTATREKAFLKALAILLVVNGGVEMAVVGFRRPGAGSYLWVAYILLSLLPTFTIAYYIYRYNLYRLVIKTSLVYAGFAVSFLAVYTYGIRHLDAFLVSRFEVRPGVVEAILILAMFAVAGPLVRIMDRTVRQLFSREIELYRNVVRQVAVPPVLADNSLSTALNPRQEQRELEIRFPRPNPSGSHLRHSYGDSGSVELDLLVRYAEETIRSGLDLARVRIVPFLSEPEGVERRIVQKLRTTADASLENDEDVTAAGGTTAYLLQREREAVGLMLVTTGGNVSTEKQAVLEVLSGQVAIGISACLLGEDKIRLERELAEHQRLAVLGQMAATVAHEVKNPLSSIKSIVQVMLEDIREDVAEESTEDAVHADGVLNGRRRDLGMIIGEIDRLSAAVSQLLAFSRLPPKDASEVAVPLRTVMEAAVNMLKSEAEERGVEVEIQCPEALTLDHSSSPIRDIIGNLILNAIQAASPGTGVKVTASAGWIGENECQVCVTGSPRPESITATNGPSGRTNRVLIVSVTDEGPGIPDDVRTRIFEPFFTTKARGTGLGLAIVERRISELGGTIEVTSPVAEGRGSRFSITIPIDR